MNSAMTAMTAGPGLATISAHQQIDHCAPERRPTIFDKDEGQTGRIAKAPERQPECDHHKDGGETTDL